MHSFAFEQIDQTVERHLDQIVGVRRRLHANPEPSGEENETSLFLYQLLDAVGLKVELGPEGRGVVAEPAGLEAPRIGMRADIDALRIHDRKDAPYRSTRDGIMHACGHDAHTACVYGAALALHTLAEEGKLPWPVPWRAIFQPAEETGLGALAMIGAGHLENVAAIIALHVDPSRPVGRIGLRVGVLTANCDDIEITVTGRGGHAARPHEANDPIAAAAQLISSIYLFVPRGADSQDAVVVTIGQVQGGDNPNVIPEQVLLKGTIRTLDDAVRDRTVKHLRQLARGLGETSGTKIDLSVLASARNVRNDPAIIRLFERAGAALLGEDNLDAIPRPSMGAEDFAFFLDHVPGALVRLGSAKPEAPVTPLHTPEFDIDERALAIGAKLLARTAVLWAEPGRATAGAGQKTTHA